MHQVTRFRNKIAYSYLIRYFFHVSFFIHPLVIISYVQKQVVKMNPHKNPVLRISKD